MKTIVAAVDFSDASNKVMDAASNLATTLGAQLHLIHAAAPNPDFVGMEVGPQHERDFKAKKLVKEHKELNRLVDELRENGISASCSLKEGMTCKIILDEVDNHDAGLLIIGSHGHGAVYSLVVGSVTLDVLKKSIVPVLVVPAKSQ